MLAQHLLEKSQDTARVIEGIRYRLTAHLQGVAERGGTSENYTFITLNKTIRTEIINWLTREGFAVSFVSSDMIHINWRQLHIGLILESRIVKCRESGMKEFSMQIPPFVADDDLKSAISSLEDKGYRVAFDDVFREILVSWR